MPDALGGISTSMYPGGAAATPNPLGMLHQFAQTQNLLNQNAMFQQEYRARQALGPILQQSIDPSTGDLDIGKFLVHGAANPAVAWKMPEITLQMIQRKYMQAETVQKELQIAGQRYSAIGDAMGGLWGKALDAAGNDPSRAKVSYNEMISAVAPLIGMHRIESKDVVTYLNGLANLPKTRDPESGQMVPDPRALALHARQWADTARGVTETLKSTENAVTPYTAGGQTLLARTSPRTGAVVPEGGIQHSLTPEQLAARVSYKDRTTGEEKVDTLGNMLRAGVPASEAKFLPPAGPAGPQGAAPAAGPARNLSESGARAEGEPGFGLPASQQPPLPPTGPGGATVPPAQSAGGGPGAGMPQGVPQGAFPLTTGLGPVREEALKEFPKYMKETGDAAGHALTMNQVIDSLEAAQRKIKTGGGAEFYVRAASLLQGLGIHDKFVDQVANGSLPASQQFQKLQLQLGTALLRAALLPGAGRITNAEFTSFQKQNPNLDTDPRAVKEMFSFLRKVNHIAYAKQQTLSDVYGAAATGGKLPGTMRDITQFEPWWNAHVVRSGAISLGGARELGLESGHPEHK